MNIAEMKEKIVEEVNKLDDEKALYKILHLLNDNSINGDKIDAIKYQEHLFKKHHGLLKRLS